MKKYITLIMLMGAMTAAEAQTTVLNLDSCRAMALRNNKQINASKLKKDVAYQPEEIGTYKYLAKGRCFGRIRMVQQGDFVAQRRSEVSIQQFRFQHRYRRNHRECQQLMADLVSKGILPRR